MSTERELREKLLVNGVSAMTDAELLALIIIDGTDFLTSLEISERMLASFHGSLSELANADISKLRRTESCGTKRAVRIAALSELSRRIAAEKSFQIDTVSGKKDILNLFSPMRNLGHEEFWAVYLTSGGRIMDKVRISQGGVNATVVDHKIIVKRAVELL